MLNGKRGFFTDSSRGADSFVPFKSEPALELIISKSVVRATGISFTLDDDYAFLIGITADQLSVFTTPDLNTFYYSSASANVNITKSNNTYTFKWSSSYTATSTMKVYGIK